MSIQKSRRPGLRPVLAHALLAYGPARTPTEREPLNLAYPVSITGRDDRSTRQPPMVVPAIDAPPLRDEPPHIHARLTGIPLMSHRYMEVHIKWLTATVTATQTTNHATEHPSPHGEIVRVTLRNANLAGYQAIILQYQPALKHFVTGQIQGALPRPPPWRRPLPVPRLRDRHIGSNSHQDTHLSSSSGSLCDRSQRATRMSRSIDSRLQGLLRHRRSRQFQRRLRHRA